MARRPLRLSAALTALIAATLGCGPAGCASGARPEGTSTTSVGPPFFSTPSRTASSAPALPVASPPIAAPTPVTTARGPADTVALAAVKASLSWDTRVDRRPNDTVRRLALPWLTPRLREQVVTFNGQASAGAEWEDWTRRHARATVTTVLGGDDRPADTTSVAHRQVQASVTLRGDGGWSASQQRTLFLRLARTGGQWRVDEIMAVQTP